jgi:hypothetical protein
VKAWAQISTQKGVTLGYVLKLKSSLADALMWVGKEGHQTQLICFWLEQLVGWSCHKLTWKRLEKSVWGRKSNDHL